MARIYAALYADAEQVLLAGLYSNDEEIAAYARFAEGEGYEDVHMACRVPLMVSGSTRKDRREDFLRKVEDLVLYASDLTYREEDEIQEWLETNAARVGAVKKLKAMGIL